MDFADNQPEQFKQSAVITTHFFGFVKQHWNVMEIAYLGTPGCLLKAIDDNTHSFVLDRSFQDQRWALFQQFGRQDNTTQNFALRVPTGEFFRSNLGYLCSRFPQQKLIFGLYSLLAHEREIALVPAIEVRFQNVILVTIVKFS